METESMEHKDGAERRRTSEENVECIREVFVHSQSRSTQNASHELELPRYTVHDMLRKCLKLHLYKSQLFQEITLHGKVGGKESAVTILDRVDYDKDFLARIMFSDEATFHVSEKVNKQNVRISRSENPHSTAEHIRDGPKLLCDVACCMTA